MDVASPTCLTAIFLFFSSYSFYPHPSSAGIPGFECRSCVVGYQLEVRAGEIVFSKEKPPVSYLIPSSHLYVTSACACGCICVCVGGGVHVYVCMCETL